MQWNSFQSRIAGCAARRSLPARSPVVYARIKVGLQEQLFLGNLSEGDWGHARDYVEMQWLMLQRETRQDYVIATGQQFSVARICPALANLIGLDLTSRRWSRGKGYRCKRASCGGCGSPLLSPDRSGNIVGDARKAQPRLGWRPRTIFNELVKEMVEARHEYRQTGCPCF